MGTPPQTPAILHYYKDSERNFVINIYQNVGYCLGWVAEYRKKMWRKAESGNYLKFGLKPAISIWQHITQFFRSVFFLIQ